MDYTYRIHFNYSRSKRYPQAVELAQLANKHEFWGEGKDVWHIVTFTEKQSNLMAALYLLAVNLPFRGVHITDPENHYSWIYHNSDVFGGPRNSKAINQRVAEEVERLRGDTGNSTADLAEEIHDNYLIQIAEDMLRVKHKLIRERRIEYFDYDTGLIELPENPPNEPIEIFSKIRELIKQERYSEAVDAYYESLVDEHYGVLTPELIYLKRLGKIPFYGRDLLYFRPESSREGLITSNLDEYVDCIDETLASLREANRQTPLKILLEYAPTSQQKIEDLEHHWHNGVYLWDGEFSIDDTPVTIDTFSFEECPEGRLFYRFPDQIRHCRVFLYSEEPSIETSWTTISPSYYQNEILDIGLHLNGLDYYEHRSWRYYRREPEFTSIQSMSELTKSSTSIWGPIEYSGRVHIIEGQEYYEIITFPRRDIGDQYYNPFLDLIQEILREAENLLRDKHGIPRIGEGWISETELFWLVQQFFPDAKQHAFPKWLKPQHLDVFVPSKKLAFEYQGRQHFEPVEFFGGQESFVTTIRRDKLKARKCKSNDVILILWKYTEIIDQPTLIAKLNQAGIDVS